MGQHESAQAIHNPEVVGFLYPSHPEAQGSSSVADRPWQSLCLLQTPVMSARWRSCMMTLCRYGSAAKLYHSNQSIARRTPRRQALHLGHVLAPWLEQRDVPRAKCAPDAGVQRCQGITYGVHGAHSVRYCRAPGCSLAAVIFRKQSRQAVQRACRHALQQSVPVKGSRNNHTPLPWMAVHAGGQACKVWSMGLGLAAAHWTGPSHRVYCAGNSRHLLSCPLKRERSCQPRICQGSWCSWLLARHLRGACQCCNEA